MPEETQNTVAQLVDELASKITTFATRDDVRELKDKINNVEEKVANITIVDEFESVSQPRFKQLKHLDEESAYTLGMLFLAGIGRTRPTMVSEKLAARANEFLKGRTTLVRGQVENNDTLGGYLVPDELSNQIVALREEYGVIRRLARVIPMSSDILKVPLSPAGPTAYFVDEAASITASDKPWGQATITAKKLAVLTRISSELNEDAIINIGDDLAGDIAYAFAEKEDDAAINGDGTAGYGGITGIRKRIFDVNGVDDGGSVVVASGNAFSEVTLSDFHRVVGRLPQYADTPRTAWLVHRTFWASVMQKLAYAAGGNDVMAIAGGMQPTFLGYPVYTSSKCTGTEANSAQVAWLGDFTQAAIFGARRGMTLDMSDQAYFASDEIAIRGTERFGFTVHSVGTDTVPGPIISLTLAAA